ncbi:MAG: addiction module protein [Micrococcales bacterium]|nr:addiction module protein [Micrococcales bacterium]MCL2666423.1 addiction module protein [Micrococcales bacterium]
MTLDADAVIEAGLCLDPDQRTVVAHQLLASLHSTDNLSVDQPSVDVAWRTEILRRLDGVLDGTATLLDGPAAHQQIRAALAEPRR